MDILKDSTENIFKKAFAFIIKNKDEMLNGNIIIFICLLTLAFHFYSAAGRFLDTDEEYYFYITSAISQGAGIYADLHSYYPPVLWYICSVFFKFSPDLFHSMLAIRVFIISLSLIGFYLIFDMFKRLKLSWFIIPTAVFIYYSMQFDLKLMEYRADNALIFVLVLQGYLIFISSLQDKLSPFKSFLMIFLFFLSFHVNQKAVYIEPPLLFAFLAIRLETFKQFIIKHRAAILFVLAGLGLFLLSSKSYHRFLYQSYIYPSIFINKAVGLTPGFSFGNNLGFLMRSAKYNLTFWLIGLASLITFIFSLKVNNIFLAPLMFMIGAALLVLTTYFPLMHYQLYCTWAVLFSMPYFIKICIDAFPQRKILIFLIVLLLSLACIFTLQHFAFPLKPLNIYAAEIDHVREAIGRDQIASFGGASIDIRTNLPFCDSALQFRGDDKYCQSRDIRSILRNKGIKFIFIDQRGYLKNMLVDADKSFIRSNYQTCHGLPLMIASKWIYVDSGLSNIDIELAGSYKILLLSKNDPLVSLDDRAVKNAQVLTLERGKHLLRSSGPAALLIEYNSDKTVSESLYDLNLSRFELIPLNIYFPGYFELLGVIKYEKFNRLFYRFFWRALSDIDSELMAFHHFLDRNGTYMTGMNIDPTDGWYDIRYVKKGETISYDFSVENNDKYGSIDVGWYFRQDMSKRLSCDGHTFFKLRL